MRLFHSPPDFTVKHRPLDSAMQCPSIPRCDQGRAFPHCGKRAHQPPVQGNSQHRWRVERHSPGCAPAFQPHSEGHGREVREGPSRAGDGKPQAMCWRGWCSQLPRAHTRLALGWGALQHRWGSLSRAALWSDLPAFLCSCKFNSCGTKWISEWNEISSRTELSNSPLNSAKNPFPLLCK